MMLYRCLVLSNLFLEFALWFLLFDSCSNLLPSEEKDKLQVHNTQSNDGSEHRLNGSKWGSNAKQRELSHLTFTNSSLQRRTMCLSVYFRLIISEVSLFIKIKLITRRYFFWQFKSHLSTAQRKAENLFCYRSLTSEAPNINLKRRQ